MWLAIVPAAFAQDGLPAGQLRALEIGAAANAAAKVFDNASIEGVIFVSDNTYRAWSKNCTVQVAVTAAFDELDPHAPPDMIADTQALECNAVSKGKE